MKKRMISAMLAMAMLFMFTACRPDAEDTVISADTSGTQSDVTTTPDAISSAEDTSSEEDISSLEYTSQPKQPVEDNPDEPAEDEEEPSPTFDETTLEALSNPGVARDDQIYLIDAPESEENWKLYRYDMSVKKLFDELDFTREEENSNEHVYLIKTAQEYLGNILCVYCKDHCEDEFFIDADENKVYSKESLKAKKSAVSVTTRKIGYTSEGQYQFWGERHPDYGKVFYSELDMTENILLTVFGTESGKQTYTVYDYDTEEFKVLFEIRGTSEVELLSMGRFVFSVKPTSETATDGGVYICNITEGVRIKLPDESRDPAFANIMENAKKGNLIFNDNSIVWVEKKEGETSWGSYIYRYEISTYYDEPSKTLCASGYVPEENAFVDLGGYIYLKVYRSLSDDTEQEREDEDAVGEVWLFGDGDVIWDATAVYPNSNRRLIKNLYICPYIDYVLCNVRQRDGTYKWEELYFEKTEEEYKVYSKKILNNPGVAIGNDLWLIDGVALNDGTAKYVRVYRYDLISKAIYLHKTFLAEEFTSCVFDEEGFGLEYHADVDYIKILMYTGEGTDYGVYDYKNGVLLDYMEGYEIFRDKYPYKIIPTEFDDPAVGDGYIEVPATYNGYGTVQRTVYLKNRNQVVISYGETMYDSNETYVVIYDYNTNKFKEILAESDEALMRVVDDRFVLINMSDLPDSSEYPEDCRLYVYDLKTGKTVKAPIDDSYSIYEFLQGERMDYGYEGVYHNGVFWWYYDDSVRNADGTRTYTVTLFTYDPLKNERRDFLKLETVDIDPFENWYFTKTGVFIKGNADYFNSLVGPLYYCTTKKTICISEKALRYFVCEDQGYVMYYEEQEDGSFEWKYYDF